MLMALVMAALISQAEPAHLSPNLPWGIKGEALIASAATPDQAVAKARFEITRDWVRCERWFASGSLGWSFQDLTVDTATESIGYEGPSRRGHRAKAFADTLISRTDAEFSPICWQRMLSAQLRAGIQPRERREGGTIIYSFPAAGKPQDVELTADLTSGDIVHVRRTVRGKPEVWEEWRYLEWRTLSNGTRHPAKIEIDRHLDGNRVANEVNVIQLVEALPSDRSSPSPYTLPTDAVIIDYVDMVQRDGTMRVVGPIEKLVSPQSQRAAREAELRPWLIGSGLTALIVAALVWRQRSRGAA